MDIDECDTLAKFQSQIKFARLAFYDYVLHIQKILQSVWEDFLPGLFDCFCSKETRLKHRTLKLNPVPRFSGSQLLNSRNRRDAKLAAVLFFDDSQEMVVKQSGF